MRRRLAGRRGATANDRPDQARRAPWPFRGRQDAANGILMKTEVPIDLSTRALLERIRELEARLARYERSAFLAGALLSAGRASRCLERQPRLRRPGDVTLPARQIAWAIAAAEGGSIERWISESDIALKPAGRVRNSAHSRIRTLVFALLDMREAQTGERI